MSEEVGLEAGVDPPEGAAGVAVVSVSGPGAAVLLHQVSHLLKLLGVNIPVPVQIKHLEGDLEVTGLNYDNRGDNTVTELLTAWRWRGR